MRVPRAPCRRRLTIAALAGCGGALVGSRNDDRLRRPAAGLGSGGKALYVGGDWAVVLHGVASVAVTHRIGGTWLLDTSRRA